MPTPVSFDYAVLRVVPRVEREEFLNAGVVLFCLQARFLGARVHLDVERLRAFAPKVDVEEVEAHLRAVTKVCAGGLDSGPLGTLSQKERFHWVVAPRSTILQASPVHSGLCEAPQTALERLLETLVFARSPSNVQSKNEE